MELLNTNFTVNNYLFDKNYLFEIENQEHSKNFPVVYIIYDIDSKQAYVGESTNVINRMGNHLANSQKKFLKYVYIISSPLFNKSAALDIESNLIKYMSADENFQLINGNAGLSEHNYYQRNIYFDIFENIWDNLKLNRVVKKDIIEIDNSDLFKYSPYKSLSEDQNEAILKYLDVLLNRETSSVFIEGSAGTGKTILAVYLIKLLNTEFSLDDYDEKDREVIKKVKKIQEINKSKGKLSVALVIPMASLRKTLKNVFKNIRGLKANMVIGAADVVKKEYDLLIVDEAHRLQRRRNIVNYGSFDKVNRELGLGNSGTELDWVLMNSNHQLFFYDPAQSIKPADVPQENFSEIKEKSIAIPLKSQMRVSSESDYIKFVHHLLNPENKGELSRFNDSVYDLKLFTSLSDLIDAMKRKEEKYGLCRMMAGYSWKWVSKKTKKPDAVIEDIELFWNRVPHDWINSTTSMNEIGCIHTTQGYDLNYAGIIFGDEITYNPVTGSIEIISENYYDKNGKNGIKDPNILKDYIINIYKTLMYRGIRGTYIYCTNKPLQEYFKKHLELV